MAGSKDTAPRPDAIPYLDAQCHIRFHENIDTRSELDEPHTFSARQRVAGAFPEYYSPRQDASDLLHHDAALLTLEREYVLLVFHRGGFLERYPKCPLSIIDLCHHPRNGRTIDVHVER